MISILGQCVALEVSDEVNDDAEIMAAGEAEAEGYALYRAQLNELRRRLVEAAAMAASSQAELEKQAERARMQARVIDQQQRETEQLSAERSRLVEALHIAHMLLRTAKAALRVQQQHAKQTEGAAVDTTDEDVRPSNGD